MPRNKKNSNVKRDIMAERSFYSNPSLGDLPSASYRGRGDYKVPPPVPPRPAAVSAPAIGALEKRVSRLESSVPKEASTVIGKGAGLAGRALGNVVGLGDVGSSIGTGLAKYFGYGDYSVTENSLMSAALGEKAKNVVPIFSKDGRRGIRVTEREYIGDVFSGALSGAATIFNNVSFPINPAMSSTFPWLSNLAANFEEWEPHGMVFEFKSTSSEFNGTSQALGTVILATDYDPVDDLYATKIEMENADYSCSSKAAENCVHGIECAVGERADKVMFTRTGAIPSGDNLRFYDLGTFQVATFGCSVAGVNLGELWVSYDVTLYKKQIVAGQLGNLTSTMTASTTTGISATAHFGTSRLTAGTLAVDVDNTTLTFPSYIVTGRYLLNYLAVGTTIAAPTFTATTNCVLDTGSNIWSGSGAAWSWIAGSGTAIFARASIVVITGPSAVITLSGGTYTSATRMDLIITQVPADNLALYVV